LHPNAEYNLKETLETLMSDLTDNNADYRERTRHKTKPQEAKDKTQTVTEELDSNHSHKKKSMHFWHQYRWNS